MKKQVLILIMSLLVGAGNVAGQCLTSAVGTDAQTVCINTPITAITYSVTGATAGSVTGGALPTGVTASFTAPTLTISGTPSVSGTFNYTITLTGGTGCTASGSITVSAAPSITGQPSSPTAVCAGTGTPSFTVTATGDGLSYQWQEYISSWNNITNGGVYSNATTATLTITNPTAGMNGYKYRCVVSGTCSPSVNSDGLATLTVQASPSITGQPSSPSAVCAGTGTPSFTVTATGTGLTYQWQEYVSSWNNITDGGVYSNATTSTLTITNPTAGMNGNKYRCVVSGTCSPSANSDGLATLTVHNSSPSITGQPSSPTAVCAGTGTPSFTVTATGDGLSYQWQEYISSWNN
ncbi:MAG: hypothetical protein HZB98_10200, partial [Bacteroidia bacterium]|nr:hypothetical protein [Bacteroidia bacterium]